MALKKSRTCKLPGIWKNLINTRHMGQFNLCVCIVFEKSINLLSLFDLLLLKFFLHRYVSMYVLKNSFTKYWKMRLLNCKLSIFWYHILSHRSVRCGKGLRWIDNFPMRVSKWSPNFNPGPRSVCRSIYIFHLTAADVILKPSQTFFKWWKNLLD